MNGRFWRATAALAGTTIGAGMFGIPYVVMRVGLGVGLSYLFILTLLTLALNLAYSKVILAAGGDHQLPGYAQVFFGQKGKFLGVVTLVAGQVGALLAYIIGAGLFLATLFDEPQTHFLFSVLFFLVASVVVYFGIRLIADLEGLISVGIIGLILSLAYLSYPYLLKDNLVWGFAGDLTSLSLLLLPVGVIFSALAGYAVIPEMVEVLGSERKKLTLAVVVGTLIPALVYLVFTLSVVGVTGIQTSPEAIAGLSHFFPSWIVRLGALFGILAMVSSYLTLAFVLRELFNKDLRISQNTSWALANFVPFLLFLVGARNFVGVLSSTGFLMGVLNTGLIVGMYLKQVKSSKLKVQSYS